MNCSRSLQSSLRAVLGLCLCVLLVVSAAPVGQTGMGPDELIPDSLSSEEALAFLRVLRSVAAYNRVKSTEYADFDQSGLVSSRRKRGFGIAGLDNVDMITSTLDRSRSRSRSRGGPLMSSGLTLHQLRALMAKAG